MKCNCEYEVGDVVGLKSGGPPMTIDKIDGKNIHCVYFDDEDLFLDASITTDMVYYIDD